MNLNLQLKSFWFHKILYILPKIHNIVIKIHIKRMAVKYILPYFDVILIKKISFVTTDICLVHLMRKLSLLKRNKLISSFEPQKKLISNFWLNFNWLDLLENKARLQSVLMTAQELVMKRSLYSRVGGGRWEEKSNIFFQKV